MIGQLIRALIYLACLVLMFYLVVWVLGILGIGLPYRVEQILMVIFALIALLVLWNLFGGSLRRIDFWGRNDPNP